MALRRSGVRIPVAPPNRSRALTGNGRALVLCRGSFARKLEQGLWVLFSHPGDLLEKEIVRNLERDWMNFDR